MLTPKWISADGISVSTLDSGSDVVSFRLVYEGELLSSNTGNHKALRDNKHEIRRQFHVQLRQLWKTESLLIYRANSLIPEKPYRGDEPIPSNEFLNYIAKRYERCGNGFVPLVISPEDSGVICSLEVIFFKERTTG